ncbi:MAG: DUF3040 domain-containing protein [Acidimicrobiales bacterium]
MTEVRPRSDEDGQHRWGPGSHDVVPLTAAERRAFDAIERSVATAPPPSGDPATARAGRVRWSVAAATVALVGLVLSAAGATATGWLCLFGAAVFGVGLALFVPAVSGALEARADRAG